MRFRMKLSLSILILFVPVGFIAILQIIALNVLLITNFSKNAKELSFQIFNETMLMQIKQRTITLNTQNRFTQTAAFVMQDILMSQQQNNFQNSLTKITQFFKPYLRNQPILNLALQCKDGFFDSMFPMQQIITYDWKEDDFINVQVYNETLLYTLYLDQKYECNIYILQSIKILQNQHYYFNIDNNEISNTNFFMINSKFYSIDFQDFTSMSKNEVEQANNVNLDELLDSKNFVYEKCPYHEITISSNQSLIYGLFIKLLKSPFNCSHPEVSKLAVIKILRDKDLIESTNKVLVDSNFNVYMITFEGLIGILFLFYVCLISIRISNSFYNPLNNLISQFSNPKINIQTLHQQTEFGCKEIQELVESCSDCIIGYQLLLKNSEMIGNDQGAQKLLDLAQLFQFYKFYKNIWQMSICANNIAQIHFYNKRYIEALKYQAQSLVLGSEEYTSIKQIEKIRKQIIQKSERNVLIRLKTRLKRFVINKFAGSTYLVQSDGLIKNRLCSFFQNQHSQQKFTEGQINQISDRLTKINLKSHYNSIERFCDSNREIFFTYDNYTFEKMLYKISLFYRRYQFASMLYKFCIKNQLSFLNESIQTITELYDDIQFSKYSHNTSLNVMKIMLLIMKFDCYRKLQQFDKAQNIIANLKIHYKSFKSSEKTQFLLNGFDIFEPISGTILKNLIRKTKASLFFDCRYYFEAGRKCIQILETNSQRIKFLNSFAYKTLMKIFLIKNLDQSLLLNYNEKIKSKQIKTLFLIDYSQQISLEQITLSHSLIAYILCNTLHISEIGVFPFNEIVFEIIRSNNIKNLKQFLDQQLKQFFIQKGGSCNLISNILKIYQNHIQLKIQQYKKEKNQKKKLKEPIHQRQSNFIFVFSEFSINFDEQAIKEIKLFQDLTKFRLVIINIANSNQNIDNSKLFAMKVNALYLENEKELQQFIEDLNQTSQPFMKQGYYEFY